MTLENKEMVVDDDDEGTGRPKYGWRRKADEEFPEKRHPYMKVKISQALPLVPMGVRYFG